MESKQAVAENFDAYIALFPKAVRAKLAELRKTIRAAAPGAVEKISYRMPTFWLEGNLVYFAAYENHIGFYPSSSGIRNFAKEISGYKNSKGAVQFPIGEPLPLKLVAAMVRFRARENLEKSKLRLSKKKATKTVKKAAKKKPEPVKPKTA